MGAPTREGGEEGCKVGETGEAGEEGEEGEGGEKGEEGEKGEAGLRVTRNVGDHQHNNQPVGVTQH